MKIRNWIGVQSTTSDSRYMGARRRLRARLAWMDEVLLDDLGISERDRAWIAASKTVVPRSWQDPPVGGGVKRRRV